MKVAAAILALVAIAATARGDIVRLEGDLKVRAATWAAAAPLVAHAGGVAGSLLGTNSREAFQASCEAGYRAIEVDFALTADNHVVARHDWRAVTAQILGQPQLRPADQPWTLAEVLGTPIHGKLHALDMPALADLMATYPQVRLVTDTKATDAPATRQIFGRLVAALRARDPRILERVVPQLYNEESGRAALEVHPFSERILTLYQLAASDDEVLALCGRLGTRVVTMPPWRARPAFLARLAAQGIVAYVHTINLPSAMAAYRCTGVYGFYTDSVRPGADPGCPEALRPAGLRVSTLRP